MPLTVSVRAFAFRLFGASHCRPYHWRIRSRACDSEIFQRQQRLGPKRILGLLVRDERGGSAEVATPADDILIEDRDRLAALTPHRSFGCLPAARGIRNRAQCGDEIVLLNLRVGAELRQLRRRLGTAERTDERLLGRIPVRLSAARRTVEFLSGGRDLIGRRVRARDVRFGHDGRRERATSGTRRARSW